MDPICPDGVLYGPLKCGETLGPIHCLGPIKPVGGFYGRIPPGSGVCYPFTYIDSSISNGDDCEVAWGSYCEFSLGGVWDTTDSEGIKCIICYNERESTRLYCADDYTADASSGDGQCESACGADAVCDEKSPNTEIAQCSSCGKSYFADKCDSNCGCVDSDDICRSSSFASGCTADSECNGVKAGTNDCASDCRYIPPPPPPPSCNGTLSLFVTTSGDGTCTITATLWAGGCDGKSWEIKDDGNTKCSGTVSGSSYSYTCPSWTVSGPASYAYNLYIGEEKKDTESTYCPGAQFCTLTLDPSTVQPNGRVSAKVMTSNPTCIGKKAYIREGSCSGTQYTYCTIGTDGYNYCLGSFDAPYTPGTYTFNACVDCNGDDDYSDPGENCSAPLVVQEAPPQPTCNDECKSQGYGGGSCGSPGCTYNIGQNGCSAGQVCCCYYCVVNKPTVTLSPSSQTGNPGVQKTFIVSVKNNNQNCGTFLANLSSSCPSGWSCNLNKTYLSIPYGQTDSSVTLSVTPPLTAIPGDYTVSVSASPPWPYPSGTGSAIYSIPPSYLGPCGFHCQVGGYASGVCKPPANIFGDGSDGSATITSNTTFTSNKNYENLTINPGVTVTATSGITIKVRGTLNIAGTITSDGKGGIGGTSGASNGSNGPAIQPYGGKGGGNNGGLYSGGGEGGRVYVNYMSYSGGSGGSYSGGGGRGAGSAGGGGGTGGGLLKIYAKSFNIQSNGKISSSGLNGGNGGSYTDSAGGGGGGGGHIYLYFGSGGFQNLGQILGKGGNGGNGSYYAATNGAERGGGSGGGGGYMFITGPSAINLGTISVSGGGGGSGYCGSATQPYNCSPGQSGQGGLATSSLNINFENPQGCSAKEYATSGESVCSPDLICCCSNCQLTEPTVTISPSSTEANSGETKIYNVSIKNNDNPNYCDPSTFLLSFSCPEGWSCSLNKEKVTIDPGATDSSVTLTVTSPTSGKNATAGQYPVTVTAENGLSSVLSGTGFGYYVIRDCPLQCQQRGFGQGECKSLYFGDGSDGSAIFSSNATIDSDKNYQNLTINQGVKVTVKSGVTIRVKGTLTVDGIITSDGQGGSAGSDGPGGEENGGRGGNGGNYGGIGGNYAGGGGGGGRDSKNPGQNGGNYSGGGGSGSLGGNGGSGGGLLKIYAWKFLVGNSGQISSNGNNGENSSWGGGGGGGGGGKIYLYFGSGGFSNSGLISAKGGNGGNNGSTRGGGGGGGGGYVKISGPTEVLPGNIDVSGGSGGSGSQPGQAGETGSFEVVVNPSLADPIGCSGGQENIGQGGCNVLEVCCCGGGKPRAENLSVELSEDTLCGIVEGARVRFRWEFVGTQQSAYQIQVDDNSDFSSPEIDTGKIISPSEQYINNSPPYLAWNKTFYWRLKVWDEKDNSSDWILGPEFTTPHHSYPAIDFEWQPKSPTINQIVEFENLSNCYDNPGTTTCSKLTGDSFLWQFEGGNPPNSDLENPTTTFSTMGEKEVSLKVTDSSGYFCEKIKKLKSTYPLPKWKEIPPFSWLEKFLAAVSSFFDGKLK